MAGLKGPERKEFVQVYPPVELAPGKAGEAMDATGGSNDLPGVSSDGAPKDCSKGLGSKENWLFSALK
jgi:hypothetical protein